MTASRVLAAIDFSDASARAVAVAGLISRACDGRLTLLHAESIEAPAYFTSEQLDNLERERRASRAAVQAEVTRFGREHTPMAFSVVVVDQTPVEAILQASATADLIVMGTHGRRGPARWWLGSVAKRALHTLAVPVLVVRSEVPNRIETLLARLVVLAESRTSGAGALEYAQSLALRSGGAVFDERGSAVAQAIGRTRATLAVVAAPQPRNAHWTGSDAEAVLRCCTIPVLFVPDFSEGVTS